MVSLINPGILASSLLDGQSAGDRDKNQYAPFMPNHQPVLHHVQLINIGSPLAAKTRATTSTAAARSIPAERSAAVGHEGQHQRIRAWPTARAHVRRRAVESALYRSATSGTEMSVSPFPILQVQEVIRLIFPSSGSAIMRGKCCFV